MRKAYLTPEEARSRRLQRQKEWREKHPNYYTENKEKFIEYSKKYRSSEKYKPKKQDPAKRRQYSKTWKSKNKDKVNALGRAKTERDNIIGKKRNRKWAAENKEHIKEYNKKYNDSNTDKIKNLGIQYRANNKDKINIAAKVRLENNPSAKISRNITSFISKSLKSNKSDKTFKLIGLQPKELKLYLESKFKDNMSWENYGRNGWHIDHIVPCSLFDLTRPEQQKSCFNYKNLQPLWEVDNIRKSNKMEVCPV